MGLAAEFLLDVVDEPLEALDDDRFVDRRFDWIDDVPLGWSDDLVDVEEHGR